MDNSRKKQRLFARRPKVREARFLDLFRKKDDGPDGESDEVDDPSLADLIKGKGKGKGKAVVVNGPLFTITTVNTVGSEVTRTVVATSVLTLEPSPPPPPPPSTTTPLPATTPPVAVVEPPKTLTPLVPVTLSPVLSLTPLVPAQTETQAPEAPSSSIEFSETLVVPPTTTADVAADVSTSSSAVVMTPGSTPYAGGWSPETTNFPTGAPVPAIGGFSSGQVAGIVAGTAVALILLLGTLLFAMRRWGFGFFRQAPDGSPSPSHRRMHLGTIFTRNNSPLRSQGFGYSAYATAGRRYSTSTESRSGVLGALRQASSNFLERISRLLPASWGYRREQPPTINEKSLPYYTATITKPPPTRGNLVGRMRSRLQISRPIPPPVPPYDLESAPPPPTITMTPPVDQPPRRSISSIVSTIFNIRRSQGPTPPPKSPPRTKGFLAPSTRGRGTPTSDDTPGAYILRQSGTSDLSGWTGPATRTSRTDSGAFIAPTALSPPLTHPRYAYGGTERDPFGRVVVRSPLAAGDRRRTVRFSMQRVDSSGQMATVSRVVVETSPGGSGSDETSRSGQRASLGSSIEEGNRMI